MPFSNDTHTLPDNKQPWDGSLLETEPLLQRLLAKSGTVFDRASARRAIREVLPQFVAQGESISQLHALGDILERLGHRGKNELGDTRRLTQSLIQGPVVLAGIPGDASLQWVLVQASSGNKFRLASSQGISKWATAQELESLTQMEGPGVFAWLQVQAALPAAQRSEASPHVSDSAHSHHDHAHPSPLSQLFALLKPEVADIWVVALFAVVVGFLGLATPIAVESLVNTVAFGRFIQPVVVISIMLLAFLGFAAVLKGLQAYIVEIIQRRIFVRVVCDLAYRLPRAQKEALESQRGPELVNRFFDVMTVQKSAATLVLDGISIVLQTGIGMGILAFYHPLLAGFDLVLILFLATIVYGLGRGGVATSIAESRAKYNVAAWLEEMAQFPVTFKSFGGKERAIDRADRLAVEYVLARKQHFRILIRQIAFSLGLQAAAGSLILGLGGWLVINGQLTLGQLVAAELIVALIVGSFAKLGKQLEVYYDLLAAVDKVGHLLQLPMEKETGGNLPATAYGLSVNMANATPTPPHYADNHEDAHAHAEHTRLSLNAAPGAIVAIMGPPRSGKSTIMDLLYGLRPMQHGIIELDNTEIRSIHPSALRKQVVLLRDVEILTGTVSENVHLDRIDVGYEEVRGALKGVCLYEDMLALPQGLETPLYPVGSPLSGSQGQLLMLARGLASRPRLLLIDELLDGVPDDLLPAVFETLHANSKNCTTLIVTGRHDIADLCDQVVTLPRPADHSSHGSSLQGMAH